MSKDKKSFLMHIDSLDVLNDLSNEQAGELFNAIRSYQVGDEMTLEGMVKIAFSPFKNQFKRDDEKYQTTCKRRAEAGSLGGKQKVANASKCKQKVANVAESDTKNKNKTKNKTNSDSDTNNNSEVTISETSLDDAFEVFYFAGLVKKSKAAAVTSFEKLVKKERCDPMVIANKLRDDIQARINSRQFGIDNLHPSTYINNRRWEDEIENPQTIGLSRKDAANIQAISEEW